MDRLARLRFETSEIADAIGVDMGSVKSWVDRGYIAPTKAPGAKGGHGCPRQYTLASARKAGIIALLATHGLSSKLASDIAAKFTDHESKFRKAGELFSVGKTWLVANNKTPRIVNTLPGASISELMDQSDIGVLTQSALVIDLSRFIESLDEKLKITNFKEQTPTYRMPGIPGEIEFK